MTNDGPTVTIERAMALLHCGRNRVFELIASGQLEVAPRFGRRTTVVTASVLAALAVGPTRPGRKRRAVSSLPPPTSRERVAELLRNR